MPEKLGNSAYHRGVADAPDEARVFRKPSEKSRVDKGCPANAGGAHYYVRNVKVCKSAESGHVSSVNFYFCFGCNKKMKRSKKTDPKKFEVAYVNYLVWDRENGYRQVKPFPFEEK